MFVFRASKKKYKFASGLEPIQKKIPRTGDGANRFEASIQSGAFKYYRRARSRAAQSNAARRPRRMQVRPTFPVFGGISGLISTIFN